MTKYIKAAISELSEEPYAIKQELANTSDSLDVLSVLAQDPDENIRIEVAMNPNISEALIRQLVSDSVWEVRCTIASRVDLPIDLLEQLSQDSMSSIRETIAENGATPESILRQLSSDDAWGVRRAVAANENTPYDLLVTLGQDPVLSVRMTTYVDYEVEVSFCGFIGASEFIEMQARPEITEEELREEMFEHYENDLLDLLDVTETEFLDYDDWDVTVNFNGYIGCDNTYNVSGDDEDEASDYALQEALWDFDILSFTCKGR